MNIPPEVARAQGHHGVKGASHGKKGGRPRLDLTDVQRKEHRRRQQEAYRRRKGILPKEVRPPGERSKSWVQEYVDIWGKPPGEPLTPEEFAKREPLWNAKAAELQLAEIREQARMLATRSGADLQRDWENQRTARARARGEPYPPCSPAIRSAMDKRRSRPVLEFDAPPSGKPHPIKLPTNATTTTTARVGRNDPCPCGSGRKFKKCCGR